MKKKKILSYVFIFSLVINLLVITVLVLNYAYSRNISLKNIISPKKNRDSPAIHKEKGEVFTRYIVDKEYGADLPHIFSNEKYSGLRRNKIKVNNEIRNAIIISSPCKLRTVINMKEEYYLDFGIYLLRTPQTSRHQIKLSVNIKNENTATCLFTKLFKKDGVENKKWCDFQVDLSPFSGKKNDIIFDIKIIDIISDSEIKDNKQPIIFLSDPLLIRKSKDKKTTNVILISIDTLRQDHLGCYGYFRNTSPNIDQFAKDKQSVIFENVISQSNWTLPAHMSMFTSQYASTHQIYRNILLKKEIETLPRILKKHGFMTCAFTTHMRVSHIYGFERGFDFFWFEEHDYANQKARVNDVLPAAANFLEKHQNYPFFLFIHLFDTHYPYDPPVPFDTTFEEKYEGNFSGYDTHLFAKAADNIFGEAKNEISEKDLHHIISLYDGEIRNVDFHLAIFFNRLKKLGLFDNTLIIITSDHGEEFREHGGMHHNTLYNEVIKIPLIIKMPKQIRISNNRINEELIQGNVDTAPTILEILDIETPEEFQGNSLLPLITGIKTKGTQPIQISERLSDWDLRTYQIAVLDRKYKYIYTTFFNIRNLENFKKNNEIFELYDLITDRKETNNLSKTMQEKIKFYNELVDGFIKNNLSINNKELSQLDLDKEQIEKLKSLGYIK